MTDDTLETDDDERSPKRRRWFLGALALPLIAAVTTGLTPLDALAAVKKKQKIVAHAAARITRTAGRTHPTSTRALRTPAGTPKPKPRTLVRQQQGLHPQGNAPTYLTHDGSGRLVVQRDPTDVYIPRTAGNGTSLNTPVRQLALYNRRNGETMRPVYFSNGRYRDDGLQAIKRFMRDWRSDDEIDIDPGLVDILWQLQRKLVPGGCIEMVCGYRSPATNAMLRRTNRGVALNSFHMYGRAMDIRIADLPLRALHTTALDLGAGGVGYYPSSNFVHVDNGPVREWGQNGRSWGA